MSAAAATYAQAGPERPEPLRRRRRIDERPLRPPVDGSPRLTAARRRAGWEVNQKRGGRRLGGRGLAALDPKRSPRLPEPGHESYPDLLRGQAVTGPDPVWRAESTYIPRRGGFLSLVAGTDWWRRYVRAGRLSNTREAACWGEAGQAARAQAQRWGRRAPAGANTDQGSQFTSSEYLGAGAAAAVRVSRAGRGRCLDHGFIERLGRRWQDEALSLRDYEPGPTWVRGVGNWWGQDNDCRLHQARGYAPPGEL